MTFAPFFGSEAFPARVKAALLLVLTAMLYNVCPVPDLPLTLLSWVRMALSEAVVGLMMGLSVQLFLEGVQLAGQLAGAQLGFSLAAIIDPQTNIETPVLTIFYQMIAMLIFLQLNVHHWILRAVVKSFGYFPVGTGVITLAAARELFRAARRDVADRRADRRSHPAGHDAHRRHHRISQQSFAATSGHVHRHLGEESDGLRGSGCLRRTLADPARKEIYECIELDGARAAVWRTKRKSTWPTINPRKRPRVASRRPARRARWSARAILLPRSPCWR